MNFIKNNLANAITLGNLFSGCIGAVHLILGRLSDDCDLYYSYL